MTDPLELISRNPRVRFRRQPLPVLAEYRLIWQVALIVSIVHIAGRAYRGSRKRVSLRKLHILGWGVRSEHSYEALRERLGAARLMEIPVVRVDPSLNQSLDFAHAEQLVSRSIQQIEMLEGGEEFALELAELGVLKDERRRTLLLKPLCTDAAISRMEKGS